ncbi:hypothetical protein BP5796_13042 [Coleophoma crateriformis]|uniref:C2H2-type domain-containing protein n=1 Tax=Coleophoma crateriformis TaxID=565419 RepID=A0A3D8Q557_9HELO|nr:hypothetical protein BP5796_13042 [Coleophoma crateriformis]
MEQSKLTLTLKLTVALEITMAELLMIPPVRPAVTYGDIISLCNVPRFLSSAMFRTPYQSVQVWTCKTCLSIFVRRDLWRRHWRITHHVELPLDDTSGQLRLSDLQRQVQPSARFSGSTAGLKHHRSPDQNHAHGLAFGVEIDAGAGSGSEGVCTANTRGIELSEEAEEVTCDPAQGVELDWQSWIGDARLDGQVDASVDLSWLFGKGLDDEQTQHVDSNQLENRAVLDDHPASSLDHRTADDLILQCSRQVAILSYPSCEFRICHALSVDHRRELVEMLGLTVTDIEPNVLALSSLHHGIHIFWRFLSKEFPILHHQVVCPSKEHRKILEERFELHSPPELVWAVITFGWSILEGENHEIYRQTAARIQEVLIKRIITHRSLSFASPLWLIQTLFLCLAFARYHGNREEYGFAMIFHGVLLDLVRRIDLRDQMPSEGVIYDSKDAQIYAWFKWIREQTMIRIIFQTFILDVQLAYLHGRDISLNPFSLKSRLPESDDVWFAPTLDKWAQTQRSIPTQTPEFLSILRSFWNTSVIKPTPYTFPIGCKVLMYGILAIAYDLRRRDDNSFSAKTLYSLESVGGRVHKSFDKWLQWWEQTYNQPQMESIHLWRNCACVFRLAHTLYEASASEWQILAGADTIDGKSITAVDYMRAKRKIKAWAKQSRATTGLVLAATIIKEKLSPLDKSMVHCTHCSWCLYLAGLICWGFGFVSQGVDSHNPPQDAKQARQQCDEYLGTVVETSEQAMPKIVNRTTGLLLVLINLLKEIGQDKGLLDESLRSLRRLVGSKRFIPL